MASDGHASVCTYSHNALRLSSPHGYIPQCQCQARASASANPAGPKLITHTPPLTGVPLVGRVVAGCMLLHPTLPCPNQLRMTVCQVVTLPSRGEERENCTFLLSFVFCLCLLSLPFAFCLSFPCFLFLGGGREQDAAWPRGRRAAAVIYSGPVQPGGGCRGV